MKLHDYLAFSKSERRAIIFLLAVIVVLAVVLSGKKKESTSDIQLAETKHTTSAEIVFDEASQPLPSIPTRPTRLPFVPLA